MRQLGGKALRVRLAHTGHQRGAAAGVQEEQAGARHALQRRLHDVAARKEPQRDAPRYGKQQAAPKRQMVAAHTHAGRSQPRRQHAEARRKPQQM